MFTSAARVLSLARAAPGALPPRPRAEAASFGFAVHTHLEVLLLDGLAVLAVPGLGLRELPEVRERLERHLADLEGPEELGHPVLVEDAAVHPVLLLLEVDGDDRREAELEAQLLLDLEGVAALGPHEPDVRAAVALVRLEDPVQGLQVGVAARGAVVQDVRQERED